MQMREFHGAYLILFSQNPDVRQGSALHRVWITVTDAQHGLTITESFRWVIWMVSYYILFNLFVGSKSLDSMYVLSGTWTVAGVGKHSRQVPGVIRLFLSTLLDASSPRRVPGYSHVHTALFQASHVWCLLSSLFPLLYPFVSPDLCLPSGFHKSCPALSMVMDIVFVGETGISACAAPEECRATVRFTTLVAAAEIESFLMEKSSCSSSLIQAQWKWHEGSGCWLCSTATAYCSALATWSEEGSRFWTSAYVFHSASFSIPALSHTRLSVPAMFQSDEPVSMAKMIMSRHVSVTLIHYSHSLSTPFSHLQTFRKPAQRPPARPKTGSQMQYTRRSASMV